MYQWACQQAENSIFLFLFSVQFFLEYTKTENLTYWKYSVNPYPWCLATPSTVSPKGN